MAVQSKLKKLKGAWKKSQAKSGNSPVPDGTYQCRIDEAVLSESKNTQRLQVGWTLKILADDQEGRMLWKYDGIETEEAMGWFKGALETLELEVPDGEEDIPDVLEAAQGLGVEVTVRTKDEFQNVYFNELIDM